jgi:hypothetical protein
MMKGVNFKNCRKLSQTVAGLATVYFLVKSLIIKEKIVIYLE